MARPRLISDEDIFDEVRRSVLESGARVSLDKVAENLGVTTPALFKRFGNRNALLIAALRPTVPTFIADLAAGPDGRPMAEQLATLFECMGAWFNQAMPCMMALHDSGIPLTEVYSAMRESPPVMAIRALSGWLSRAEGKGLVCAHEPKSTAMAMLGAIQTRTFIGRIMNNRTDRASELARDAKRFAQLFLDGIKPKKPVVRSPNPALKRARA